MKKFFTVRFLTAGFFAATSIVAANAYAQDVASLAQKYACMSCHRVDSKLVGPSFKAVAKRYAGQDGAAEQLFQKVKTGGSGVWGAIPMPPNSHVPDSEIRTLVNWILHDLQ